MDMDQSAVFLAGSILTALGFLVILAALIIANNLIHKYWKNLGWRLLPHWADEPVTRFATEEELKNGKPVEERNENRQAKQK